MLKKIFQKTGKKEKLYTTIKTDISATDEFLYYDIKKTNKNIISKYYTEKVFISPKKWNRSLVNAQAKYIVLVGLTKPVREVMKDPVYQDFTSKIDNVHRIAMEKMIERYGPEKDKKTLKEELQHANNHIIYCKKQLAKINRVHVTEKKTNCELSLS